MTAHPLRAFFRAIGRQSEGFVAAGPSSGRAVVSPTSSTAARGFASSSRSSAAQSASKAPATYPFSSSAIVYKAPQSHPAAISQPPLTKSASRGIVASLTSELRVQYDPTGRRTALFSRNSPERIPVGSVLIVESWTSPAKTNVSTFSGVLIAIRRRGTSTSFVLRNIVNKLGTEVRYNLYSPLLKDVRVIQRADAGKRDKTGRLRRARRAKLYYLRKDDRKIAAIGRSIQQARAREQRLSQEKNTRGSPRAAAAAAAAAKKA